MGFYTKRNNKKGLLIELHTFIFQGLYLTGFNPAVKACNILTTNLDTNFTHESMMNLQPPKIFCGCHAETKLHIFPKFIFKNLQQKHLAVQ